MSYSSLPMQTFQNRSCVGCPHPTIHTQCYRSARCRRRWIAKHQAGVYPSGWKSGGMTLSVYCWLFQRALLPSQQTSCILGYCCMHGWW